MREKLESVKRFVILAFNFYYAGTTGRKNAAQ